MGTSLDFDRLTRIAKTYLLLRDRITSEPDLREHFIAFDKQAAAALDALDSYLQTLTHLPPPN